MTSLFFRDLWGRGLSFSTQIRYQVSHFIKILCPFPNIQGPALSIEILKYYGIMVFLNTSITQNCHSHSTGLDMYNKSIIYIAKKPSIVR